MKTLAKFLLVGVVLVSLTHSKVLDGVNYPYENALWTPETSVGVRFLIRNWKTPAWPESSIKGMEAIQVAPDGRHFFLMTRQGVLESDSNLYRLSVWSTMTLKQDLALGRKATPLRTIEMTTNGWVTDSAGICDASWQDNSSIVFRGTGEIGSSYHVYQFDVQRNVLNQLSKSEHNVESFSAKGTTIVYNAVRYFSRPRGANDQPVGYDNFPLQPIRGDALGAFLMPSGFSVRQVATFATTHNGKSLEIAPFQDASKIRIEPVLPSISPDGLWAVVSVPVLGGNGIPKNWLRYENLDAPFSLLPSREMARLRKLIVVDMLTGTTRHIVDAPLGPDAKVRVFWLKTGNQVVIVNTSLPLQESNPERQRLGYIISYDVKKGEYSVIEPILRKSGDRVRDVRLSDDGVSLLIWRGGDGGESVVCTRYTYEGGRWASVSIPSVNARAESPGVQALADGISIIVKESGDDAPVPYAVSGIREVPLLEPDPSLHGIWRAPVEKVKWVEQGGHTEHGMLMLPREAATTKPFPLVIQLEGVDSEFLLRRFRPDGPHSTAFAAQSLVAQGMAVLQIGIDVFDDHPPLPRLASEGEYTWLLRISRAGLLVTGAALIRARVEAAVDMLARKGLIDKNRVGLVGFSRTGFYVHYIISHPGKLVPAAAIIAGSTTEGYGQQMVQTATAEDTPYDDTLGRRRFYGGSFWDKEAQPRWLEHAPCFNTDRVQTPALFTYNGWLSNLEVVEPLAAFRQNKREIDVMLFPEASHQISRPRSRIASMQATVDWMNFWLQGLEDNDPEKNEQYWYWRKLRQQRDERLADLRGRAQPEGGQSTGTATVFHARAK